VDDRFKKRVALESDQRSRLVLHFNSANQMDLPWSSDEEFLRVAIP